MGVLLDCLRVIRVDWKGCLVGLGLGYGLIEKLWFRQFTLSFVQSCLDLIKYKGIWHNASDQANAITF